MNSTPDWKEPRLLSAPTRWFIVLAVVAGVFIVYGPVPFIVLAAMAIPLGAFALVVAVVWGVATGLKATKRPATVGLTLGLIMIAGLYLGREAAIDRAIILTDFVPSVTENQMRSNLGTVRSAISIYKGDMQHPPSSIAELTDRQRYLQVVPRLPAFVRDGKVHRATVDVVSFATFRPDDRGGWGYVNAPRLPDGRPNPDFGRFFINCTHRTLRGDVARLCDL